LALNFLAPALVTGGVDEFMAQGAYEVVV
jgi:hypothetical protein